VTIAGHHALQRAVVIALHDPGFVDAMHADPEGTLGPLGVGERERAWLLAADRRAFRTDPLRTRRVLRVVADELKASTTLALAETRSMAFAEAFFASPSFRKAILERRALVPAFADYLADAAARGRLASPHVPDVVRVEGTRARCRRAAAEAPAAGGVTLAPGVAVGRFDGGVLETINRLERWVFEAGLMPQAALCDDAPGLPPLPPLGEAPPICLLFSPSPSGVAIAPIDEDLHGVLAALATPVPRGELPRVLEPCGVPPARAAALVESLRAEGLVA
jgi:hypothetical protein